jgi:hypothetical protein
VSENIPLDTTHGNPLTRRGTRNRLATRPEPATIASQPAAALSQHLQVIDINN